MSESPKLPHECLYVATRAPDAGGPAQVVVLAEPAPARPLHACNHIRNHSPDGFQWGYAGSGPAQLALALCVHALTYGTERKQQRAAIARAQRSYQRFKVLALASCQLDRWQMSSDDVRAIVDALESRSRADGDVRGLGDEDDDVLYAVVRAHAPRAVT